MHRIAAALTLTVGLSACAGHAADPRLVLHYLRSDADGSEAERIVMFRDAPGSVAVFKQRRPCANAALVTARVNGREPTLLIGGRLTPSLDQQAFGWLRLEDDRRVTLSTEGEDGATLEAVTLGPEPWRLYDFDFADWNALTDGPPPQGDFTVDLILARPEPDEAGPILSRPGAATLRRIGPERREGRDTVRYEASGPAFPNGVGGPIWLDAADGAVVEVQWSLPNHPGYDAYRLRLTDRAAGEAAWRAVLAAHFEDCPPD